LTVTRMAVLETMRSRRKAEDFPLRTFTHRKGTTWFRCCVQLSKPGPLPIMFRGDLSLPDGSVGDRLDDGPLAATVIANVVGRSSCRREDVRA
jgi:hypothetical protein